MQRWSLLRIVTCLWLVGSALAFNQRAINAFKKADQVKARVQQKHADRAAAYNAKAKPAPKREGPSLYLNEFTSQFVVDGADIPEVDFDIGESYAGLLPISDDPEETRKLYFWFFPSDNPKAVDEIVIWFNGGPGCSSLSGMLTENGPFLWQQGTLAPVPNSYSWTNLTNMLFVEQPVGVGYTQGTPDIVNEFELGIEFVGFYKQFVEAFQVYGSKVYLTGESYAGYYIPYIANAFIDYEDPDYWQLAGLGINDPILGDSTMQEQVVLQPFADYWSQLFYFNETFTKFLTERQAECNFTWYIDTYYKFPPPAGPFPVLPYPDEYCDMFDIIYEAALEQNPCFNIYHITDTCPHTYSQLGIVNSGDYDPPGSVVYFNRTDVQKAINAPVGTNWEQCTSGYVFDDPDDSDYSLGPAQNGVLQRVIEYLNNTIIGVGNLDYILCPNGTLFALQNTTWHGLQGFQAYPQQNPFYVPYHIDYNGGRLSEEGTVGFWGEERGLIFYTVQLSGHELPGYVAGSGFRMLEKLLGRIDSLSSDQPFTTQVSDDDEDEDEEEAGLLKKVEDVAQEIIGEL